jgi:hypothetical protein
MIQTLSQTAERAADGIPVGSERGFPRAARPGIGVQDEPVEASRRLIGWAGRAVPGR